MIDKEKYINELKELSEDDDTEMAHVVADTILCSILTELGYGEIVEEYDKIGKWYA